MEFFIIFIALIGIVIYFLPTIIASKRNSNSTGIIFLVNLLAGWTVIVWLITLIWAAEGRTKEKEDVKG